MGGLARHRGFGPKSVILLLLVLSLAVTAVIFLGKVMATSPPLVVDCKPSTPVYCVPAPSGVAETDTSNIQRAIDAMPDGVGGTIVLQAGSYTLSRPVTGYLTGTTIVGSGGTAQGLGLTQGTTRIIAPPSGWAFDVGKAGEGNANFSGATFRDLQIVGNDTAAGGIWIKGHSNFRIQNCTVTGFTAGTGLLLDSAGSGSQYGELSGFQSTDNHLGLDVRGTNGLRILGGMFDGNHNSGSPRSGSTAIRVTEGDTLRMFGTVIQYYETGVDLAVGINSELYGVRFEGFATAVHNAAPSTRIYGGSFDNSILGAPSGTAVKNDSTARQLFFDPGDVTEVLHFLVDQGSGTQTPVRRLASKNYNPTPSVTRTVSGSSSEDVDHANATISFDSPPSGTVTLKLSTNFKAAEGSSLFLFLRRGGSDVPGTRRLVAQGGSNSGIVTIEWEVSQLVPGERYTYDLGVASSGGVAELRFGDQWGPLAISVTG
ncbi:hypothetical protein ACSVHC_09055 [Arthrobacter sp. KNU-44]|uniref:hypothetical protein n=1 Tax=Arthrobacter sp. KNU-44 TaxID=3450744 RepID=UPI003F42E0B7